MVCNAMLGLYNFCLGLGGLGMWGRVLVALCMALEACLSLCCYLHVSMCRVLTRDSTLWSSLIPLVWWCIRQNKCSLTSRSYIDWWGFIPCIKRLKFNTFTRSNISAFWYGTLLPKKCQWLGLAEKCIGILKVSRRGQQIFTSIKQHEVICSHIYTH